MMQQLMQQCILPDSKAPLKNDHCTIKVFSPNPVPSEKTFLKDLEANNLYPLKHSLKKERKKDHTMKCTAETSWKAVVSHCLYIYFVYIMSWYV